MKAWNVSNGLEKFSFKPQSKNIGVNPSVFNFFFLENEKILVNTNAKFLHISDLDGKTLKRFGVDAEDGLCLEGSVVSNHHKYAYSYGNNGYLYFFNLKNFKLESFSKVTENSIIEIAHHPHKNLIVYTTEVGELTFMTP